MQRFAERSALARGFLLAVPLALAIGPLACGGAAAPPADAPPAPAAAPAAAAGPVAASAPQAPQAPAPAAPAAAPAASEPAWIDPGEKPDGFELVALFDKTKSKGSFPKKTVGDADCWTSIGVTGDHAKDFQAIVAACGTPTGLVEYAKPIEGKLHHAHDPRDVYKLKVMSNYCYRYFAVADDGIKDLDLLIEKPGGALIGDDKTSSPVAIIESDKPWCQDEDQTIEFHVEVKAGSRDNGHYVLGVWARPKQH
jgi:hypothetical protein